MHKQRKYSTVLPKFSEYEQILIRLFCIQTFILNIVFKLSMELDPNLCSHLYALCFIAQSLFDHEHQLQARRCTEVCPHLSIFQIVKVLNPSDQAAVYDNNIANDTPETIELGMNISER